MDVNVSWNSWCSVNNMNLLQILCCSSIFDCSSFPSRYQIPQSQQRSTFLLIWETPFGSYHPNYGENNPRTKLRWLNVRLTKKFPRVHHFPRSISKHKILSDWALERKRYDNSTGQKINSEVNSDRNRSHEAVVLCMSNITDGLRNIQSLYLVESYPSSENPQRGSTWDEQTLSHCAAASSTPDSSTRQVI